MRAIFKGISWKVPSGNVRLIVIGKIAASISFNAMSIGFRNALFNPHQQELRTQLICNARAPTILAFSNRVTFGGPTFTLFFLTV